MRYGENPYALTSESMNFLLYDEGFAASSDVRHHPVIHQSTSIKSNHLRKIRTTGSHQPSSDSSPLSMKFLLVLAHLSVLSASVLGATVAPSRRPLRAVQKYAGVRAKGYLVKLNDDASRTDILKEIKLIGSDAGRRNRLANLQRLLR